MLTFIISFNHHLFNIYYIPSTVFNAAYKNMSKTHYLEASSSWPSWSLWFMTCHYELGFGPGPSGLPWWLNTKESTCNVRYAHLIPGSGRSLGEGNSSLLQYSCLENPMDREVWQAAFHGVTRVGHDLATKPPSPTWPKDKALKKPNSLYTFNLEEHK